MDQQKMSRFTIVGIFATTGALLVVPALVSQKAALFVLGVLALAAIISAAAFLAYGALALLARVLGDYSETPVADARETRIQLLMDEEV